MPANQHNVTYLLAGMTPDDLPDNLRQVLEAPAYVPINDDHARADLIFLTADRLTETDHLLSQQPYAHFVGMVRHPEEAGAFFSYRISTLVYPALSPQTIIHLLDRSVVRANGRRWRNDGLLSYQIFADALWLLEHLVSGAKCQIVCLHEMEDQPYAQLLALQPLPSPGEVIDVATVRGWRAQAEKDPSFPAVVDRLEELNGHGLTILLRLTHTDSIDEPTRRLLRQVTEAVIYAVRHNNAHRRRIVLTQLREGSQEIIRYLNALYNAPAGDGGERLEDRIVRIAHAAMREDGVEDEHATWVAAVRFDIDSGDLSQTFTGLAQYPLHPDFASDRAPLKPLTYTRNNGHTDFIIREDRPVVIPSVALYAVNAQSMGYLDSEGNPIPINPRSLSDNRHSILGLPLRYAGSRVIGALWFHFNSPRMLYPSTVADLQLFADQVSHALRVSYQIERDRLWNEVINEIARIYEDFQAQPELEHGTGSTLDDMPAARWAHYQRIVETLRHRLKAKNVVYFPYDARHNQLDMDHPISAPPLDDALLEQLDHEGIIRQHDAGEIRRQTDDEDGFSTPFREQEKIRSAIVVPLRRPDDHWVSYGILYINFSSLGYTVSHGLAETLRDVVRTFIEALDRRLKSANLLALGRQIIDNNPEDTHQPKITKDDFVRRVHESTDAAFVGSVWYDDAGNMTASINYDGQAMDYSGRYRQGEERGHSEWIRLHRQPVIIEDVALYHRLTTGTASDHDLALIEERYPHYFDYTFSDTEPLIPINPVHIEKESRCALGFPIRARRGNQTASDEVVGVLWLIYEYPRRFTRLEMDEFQQHANHAAMMYVTSRRIQRHQRALDLLSALVQELKPELPMRRVFRIVSREANRIIARTDDARAIDYTAHRVHFVRVERGRRPWRIRFYAADYYKPAEPGEAPQAEWADGEKVYNHIVGVMHNQARTTITEDYVQVDISDGPPYATYLGQAAADESVLSEGYGHLPDASQNDAYVPISERAGSQIVVPIYHYVNVPWQGDEEPPARVLTALLNVDHQDVGELTQQDAITLRALGVTLGFLLDQRYRQRVTAQISQVAQALAQAIRDEPAHNADHRATQAQVSRAVVEAAFSIAEVKAPPDSPLLVMLYLSTGSPASDDQWYAQLTLVNHQGKAQPALEALYNGNPNHYRRITLDSDAGEDRTHSLSKRAAIERRIQYSGDRPRDYDDPNIERVIGQPIRSQVSIPIMELDDKESGEDIIAELYRYVESHPVQLAPVGAPDAALTGVQRLPGRVIGVLTVQHASCEAFTMEDIVHLYTLSQLTSVMLTSRRDMETLQKVVSAAIDLSDITHNIGKVIEPALNEIVPAATGKQAAPDNPLIVPVLTLLSNIYDRVPLSLESDSPPCNVNAVLHDLVKGWNVTFSAGIQPVLCRVPERWLRSILVQMHRNSQKALEGYEPAILTKPTCTDPQDVYTQETSQERITLSLNLHTRDGYAEIVVRNSGRRVPPALEQLLGVSHIPRQGESRPLVDQRTYKRLSEVIQHLNDQYNALTEPGIATDADQRGEQAKDVREPLELLKKLQSARLPTSRGIGLVIARRVLRAYGGDLIYRGARYIVADPTNPEQRKWCGAIFCIRLPLVTAGTTTEQETTT